jgi:hypothetical protein
MERQRNAGQAAPLIPDFAEPVIGRRFAPTRWLHPGYERREDSPYITGSTLVYFTCSSAKLDSMEATPSRRVSFCLRNCS